MKQFLRISVLVFALLLLTGCAAAADPTPETTIPTTEATLPTEPTTPATMPAETAPPETTAPAALTPAAAGFDAVYADICRLLDTGDWELGYAYATVGMVEVMESHSTREERYNSITYALEDLDGDGSVEMIVLDAMGNTRIIAFYAIRDGQPVLIREGGYRARHYKLDDGTLYSEGSNGAAYSVFEAYGQCWFTWPKGDDQMEIGFYHAEDGSYDPAAAREITADEYEAKQIELAQKITAFSAQNFG